MSYIYDLTDTWNAGGTTFTAIKMNVTDTASAAGSLLLDLQVGGASQFNVRKDGRTFSNSWIDANVGVVFGSSVDVVISSASSYGVTLSDIAPVAWTSGNAVAAQDLVLRRDAANTLAQRNGTNAQAFRVYSTYTDASNYERVSLDWSGNVAYLRTQRAGTGAGRDLQLEAAGSNITFTNVNGNAWQINVSRHLLAATDNAFDIGASGANRPRNVYVGTNLVAGGGLYLGSTGAQVGFQSNGGGILQLANGTLTDFGRLQFGGTTSSFPSLKRNGAELQCRLADDSGPADFLAKSIDLTGTLRSSGRVQAAYTVAIPAGGTANLGLTVSSTSNFGVFFGSGAPTLSAAKGSLYLRSDGTTTNDRAYINTDGATTWTALTTAA